MIPATDEDRLKSMIYRQLDGSDDKLDYSGYVKMCRSKYEEEKYAGHKLRFNPKTTLEEELLSFAYSYHNSTPDKHRRIDARALKAIKKHNGCTGTDHIAMHFFRVYNDIKRVVADFLSGYYYVEHVGEYVCSVETVPKDKLSSSLEDELVKLAEEYEKAPENKKRKIDFSALQTIRRCGSCKNSKSMTRSYYRIYYHMTGRGRIQDREKDM